MLLAAQGSDCLSPFLRSELHSTQPASRSFYHRTILSLWRCVFFLFCLGVSTARLHYYSTRRALTQSAKSCNMEMLLVRIIPPVCLQSRKGTTQFEINEENLFSTIGDAFAQSIVSRLLAGGPQSPECGIHRSRAQIYYLFVSSRHSELRRRRRRARIDNNIFHETYRWQQQQQHTASRSRRNTTRFSSRDKRIWVQSIRWPELLSAADHLRHLLLPLVVVVLIADEK